MKSKHLELFTAYNNPVEVWNVKTGEKIREFDIDEVGRVFFGFFLDNDRIQFSVESKTNVNENYVVEVNTTTEEIIRRTKKLGGYVRHILRPSLREDILVYSGSCLFQVVSLDDLSIKSTISDDGDLEVFNHAEYCSLTDEIFLSSLNNKIKIYSIEKEKVCNNIPLPTFVTRTEYVENRKMVLTSSGTEIFRFSINDFRAESRQDTVIKRTNNADIILSFRTHEDGNLVFCGGFDWYNIYDIRTLKADGICTEARKDQKIGEIWRQQLIGNNEICFGGNSKCRVIDWNGKIVNEWDTKSTHSICFAGRFDQLKNTRFMSLGREDLMERRSYLFENREHFKHIKIIINETDFFCLYVCIL